MEDKIENDMRGPSLDEETNRMLLDFAEKEDETRVDLDEMILVVKIEQGTVVVIEDGLVDEEYDLMEAYAGQDVYFLSKRTMDGGTDYVASTVEATR